MKFYDVHTHKVCEEQNVISIMSSSFPDDDKLCSAGIHPWHIKSDRTEKLALLDSIACKPNILAIGEIGLDKVCNTDFELQKVVFAKQLFIAQKHKKPVIIHCVRALDEMLSLTKIISVPMIIHGFNKGAELARQLLDRGFYLSFGKSLFDSNSKSADAFEKYPLTQVFLETDESDFTIKEVYKRASEIKKIELEVLSMQIELNFKKVFNGSN